MKRIVVISDIHSNYKAFEAAFVKIQDLNPNGIIFLGDYVTDFPYPQKTMKILYKCREMYKCWFVRGNREDYLLNHTDNPNDEWCYNNSSTGSLLYTYDNLSKNNLDFFKNMPICMDIKIDDCPLITACHGSTNSTNESLFTSKVNHEFVSKFKGEILLCGHSHHKKLINYSDKQIVFCPSLGLPQDSEAYGCSNITILEMQNNKWIVKFTDICYDVDSLITDYKTSELMIKAPTFSKCIIKNIKNNDDFAYQCILLAWEIAKKDNFIGGNILPEKYWIKAYEELDSNKNIGEYNV